MSQNKEHSALAKRLTVFLRQSAKGILQNALLPIPYNAARRSPIRKGLVLFADLHHNSMPHCMDEIFRRVSDAGYETEEYFFNINELSPVAMWKKLRGFMKLYARAEYVFICNYFFPVSSCKKRPETTVIQLWHSGGIFKKIGYDTADDLNPSYHGDPFRNFDYVLLSSENCRPVWSGAMRLPEDRFLAYGMPRTDVFYSPEYQKRCTDNFFKLYPQSKGKKIAIWAPTFRGKPHDPYIIGQTAVASLQEKLGNDWYIVNAAHPSLKKKYPELVASVPTEELLCAADILITDYSSVLFDWLLYRKPFVIFAPDLEEYEKTRGLYTDCRSMPTTVVTDESRLAEAVLHEFTYFDKMSVDGFAEYQIGSCDGHASDRVLSLMSRLSGASDTSEIEKTLIGS